MRLLLTTAAALFLQLSFAQIDYKGLPQWSWGKKDSTEYYLYTPSSLQKGDKYPLMLFLHGCCGDDYHATLRNTVDPPVRLWHDFANNQQQHPTFILSPKTSRGWKQHIPNLKAVIDSLIGTGAADPQRIYISGFSMGAQGTWEFIEQYPDFFAAAVPMGMDFKGKDPQKFTKVPIWAIRGDKDWWARHLGTQIKTLRSLTIENADSAEWHTGINPRLTNFEGMGHVVMWPAVRELDIRTWVYSKENNGNQYPSVILRTPSNVVQARRGEEVSVPFQAHDPDGKIVSVVLAYDGKNSNVPLTANSVIVNAAEGDRPFELRVTDDKGKTAVASGIIRTEVPTRINTTTLPSACAGEYFSHQLNASGNGIISWKANGSLPPGIRLSNDGVLSGVPGAAGKHSIEVMASDETHDVDTRRIEFSVDPKKKSAVVINNVRDHKGDTLPLSVVAEGMSPHVRGDDEVTLSGDLGNFKGLTMIMTNPGDTSAVKDAYIRFTTDDDATVYVAYEKLDNLFRSTIPAWLKEYKPEGKLTAQYYYYEVYSKDFAKGEVVLPDPQRKVNGVNNNYFVLVKKKEKK